MTSSDGTQSNSTSIRVWLAQRGLAKFIGLFEEHAIGTDVVTSLDNQDLREMGISGLGNRKKVLNAIVEARGGESGEAGHGRRKREYRISQLGRALSGSAIQELEYSMTSEGKTGWRFHSVIPIVKTGGCLNTPQGTVYLAVYERYCD